MIINYTATEDLNLPSSLKITGNLTVYAPNATVNNRATVTNGTITIKDVKLGTWNELVSGNTLVFDAEGKTLNITNGVAGLTINVNATVITPNSVNAVVASGATVTVKETEQDTGIDIVGSESTNIIPLNPKPENWSVLADTAWYNDNDSSFTVNTASQLAGLAKLVNEGNNFANKAITLGTDIDLQDIEWIPIGTPDNDFKGTFNGSNKIISNLAGVNGLFGKAGNGSAIKNVIIDGLNINGNHNVGGIVGDGFITTIENCKVRNANISGGNYVGGILGHNGYGPITNCNVEKSNIVGSGISVGGLVGLYAEGNSTNPHTISGCTVSDTNVTGYFRTGGLVGLLHYGTKVEDCTVTNGTISSEPYRGETDYKDKYIKTGTLIGDVITTEAKVIIINSNSNAELGFNMDDYHRLDEFINEPQKVLIGNVDGSFENFSFTDSL